MTSELLIRERIVTRGYKSVEDNIELGIFILNAAENIS